MTPPPKRSGCCSDFRSNAAGGENFPRWIAGARPCSTCPHDRLMFCFLYDPHVRLSALLIRFVTKPGTIELHELQQVMRKLGQNPSEAELIEMISTVDDNGDNEIDFEEFMILMKSRIGEKDPEKELRDAFRVFDTDNSGSIDKKELKRLMKKLGQALSEAELDAMMDEVDTNGDGEISFEEFKELMVRQTSYADFLLTFSIFLMWT